MCPNCGDRDGCFVWLEADGCIHWFCNVKCMKWFSEKAFFEIMGWEWDGFVPVRENRAPVIPEPYGPADLCRMRLTQADAQRYHDNGWKRALDMLAPLGFDEQTVHDSHIGYVSYKPTMGGNAGRQLAGITFPRYYTMPDGSQKLMGIRVRRDDSVAERDETGAFFQPKYLGLGGGFVHGAYFTNVVCSPNGTYRAPHLDGLFLCEDEKTANILKRGLRGHPDLDATAYVPEWHWDWYMDVVVSNVSKVIVLQDSEPDKIRKDGSRFNPGLDRALKVQGLIKKRPVYILAHPEYKQLSDMAAVTGVEAVIEWLSQQKACSNLF